jgi:HD-GYP domain-containing protein (c-di-GMP phosphodiesterase class II)
VVVEDAPGDPQSGALGRRFLDNGTACALFLPLPLRGHRGGVLWVETDEPRRWSDADLALAQKVAIAADVAIDNAALLGDLRSANDELAAAYESTIEGWARALDLRDRETEGHSRRVTELTLTLLRVAGFTENELVHARRGALLHDIGKMGVPDTILLKPGPLTDEEWEVMRMHPDYALMMLDPIPHLRPALDIPHCHHERWDGTGYPRGLAGEDIPMAARVFAAVDVWDALLSDRPYRPAWPEERVLEYLESLEGTHLDPYVLRLFMDHRARQK